MCVRVLYNDSETYSFLVIDSVAQCINIKWTHCNIYWIQSGVYDSETLSVRENLWAYVCDMETRTIQLWL